MKNSTHILAALTLALLLTSGQGVAHAQSQLQGVSHKITAPGSEQISLQLDSPSPVNTFTLDGQPPRIIFDFPGMTYTRAIKHVLSVNGPMVQRVRVGMHEGSSPKTRVVFDLKSLKGVTYTSSFDKAGSTLTIQFTGPATSGGTKPVAGPAAQPTQKTRIATGAPRQPDPAAKASKTASLPDVRSEAETAAEPPAVTGPGATTPASPVAAQPTDAEPAQPAATTDSKPTASAPGAKPAPDTKPAPTGATKEPPAPKKDSAPVQAAQPAPEPRTQPATTETEAAEEPPRLESISFDPDSSKGEMVLFRLNGFHPPTIHGVEEGVPRVICEFTNTNAANQLRQTIKANGQHVKTIRTTTTSKPQKIRVVIDLEPNRSYDLQQVFFKDENLFVLIVNTVSQ